MIYNLTVERRLVCYHRLLREGDRNHPPNHTHFRFHFGLHILCSQTPKNKTTIYDLIALPAYSASIMAFTCSPFITCKVTLSINHIQLNRFNLFTDYIFFKLTLKLVILIDYFVSERFVFL